MVVHNVVGGHGIARSLEMVEAVMEVADIAWTAYEHRRDHKTPLDNSEKSTIEGSKGEEEDGKEDEEVAMLRSENSRLRAVLEENVKLLKSLSEEPALSKDCPPDLHVRLVAAVDSASFLAQLEALHEESRVSTDNCFPFKEAQGMDSKLVDALVHDNQGNPNCWVLVNKDLQHDNMEEFSGLDSEPYVMICEDDVVDAIASFIAKCILANPKSKKLPPEELQKTVSRALGGMKGQSFLKCVWSAAKLIYALSTWGILLAGLYRHPAIVKAAARGVAASGKLVMKAL